MVKNWKISWASSFGFLSEKTDHLENGVVKVMIMKLMELFFVPQMPFFEKRNLFRYKS